jgi:LysR family nitrogen assimilation transcriptional regulator
MMREKLMLVSAGTTDDRSFVPMTDILGLPLAMPGENDALRGIVEAQARQLDLPLSVAFEISSIAAIKELAAKGLAHAILPFGAVRREVMAGELVARPIANPTVWRTLYLVRPMTREVGIKERQLEDVIRDCLAGFARAAEGQQAYEMIPEEG